jgi:outer membrane protein
VKGMLPYLLSAVLILSLTGYLAGEELPTPTATLSLEEVINIALENQVDVLVGQNNLDAAQNRVTQSKSRYFPQISVQNNTFTSSSGDALTQRRTGTAIAVTHNIYDGGLREANIARTKHGVTENEAALARTIQAVVFDTTSAYYEVLRAKQLAEVAQASVKYNEALIEVVQSRVELGDAASVDILPVQSQLAAAKVNLIAAQNSVRVAKIRLQNTIGLYPQAEFDVQPISTPPSAELQALETYLSEAMNNRPDISQAQAAIGSSKASAKAAKISLYPIPQVTAEYQRGLGGLSGNSTQIFGGISFNLFDGGANRAAYREAKANQESAEKRHQQLIKDIEAQVRQAHINVNDSIERLSASQIGLETAQKNYEVQQERYKQGLAIPLDLLNAEVQVVTAQTNLVQAQYDLYIAMAQLDFAVGRNGVQNGKQD